MKDNIIVQADSTSFSSTNTTAARNDITSNFQNEQIMARAPRETNSFSALMNINLTPFIKEELKQRIQLKRLNEGKDELKAQFTSPAPYILTAKEKAEVKEKIERRRAANREAARRCREKKKSRIMQLSKVCEDLKEERMRLQYELDVVRIERDTLLSIVEQYKGVCFMGTLHTTSGACESKMTLDSKT